jgi:anthranilate synthase component 2
MHGKTSRIEVTKPTKVFKKLPEEFTATRYHSLVVNQENLPSVIKPTAYSKDDHEIMALEIEGYEIYGIQFHPESIMSEYGHEMIDNFLKI